MEILLFTLVLALGASLGSFSNCISQRLISGQSFVIPSSCNHCKSVIQFRDLIPVISYLNLKAKCRTCKIIFSKSYLYAELFLLGLSALGYFALGLGGEFWIYMGTLPFIAIAIFTDFEVQKIPDLSSIGIAVLGLLQMFIHENYNSITSLFIVLFLMLLLRFIFAKALHKDALGDGDFYLILATALWVQPLNLPIYIFTMGLVGVGTSLFWRHKFHSDQFPFAPAIVFSMLICHLFL